MIGQTLNTRYTITSRLGEGGMGEVFQAADKQTGQQVAVKALARQLTLHPEALERFKREGETLRQLKHPNIVGFVDAFEHENQYVIVMEYVPGGSLHDLIKQGHLPIERAQQIALDLCDALIRAHKLNIIHRDIKPENVLLAEDGTPKLADFGVARLNEGTRMTRTGTQVGTPYYMAPEAWEGKTLDAQADIWSLGVLLFEMLTGKVPFGGDTSAAVMNKILTSQPPDLKKLRIDVSLNLTQIIKRMLTRDKNKRYRTMREVAVDLERGQHTNSVKVRWLPALIGFGFVLAISTVWIATRFQSTQSNAQVISPTNTPRPTATSKPSRTPAPTSIATIVPTPMLSTEGTVVRSDSFDKTPVNFSVSGQSEFLNGVLTLFDKAPVSNVDNSSEWNDGFASLNSFYFPTLGDTSVLLFKAENKTTFIISYDFGSFGNTSFHAFWLNGYSAGPVQWVFFNGEVASSSSVPSLSVPIPRFKRDVWYYLILHLNSNGLMEASLVEKDNPASVIRFSQNFGPEWAANQFGFIVQVPQGKIDIDEFQEVEVPDVQLRLTTVSP